MKTQLDSLIKDLSAERISAGFWGSVLEYIDSTLNFEGLLSPLSAASDAQGQGQTMSKMEYGLTQRDSVCPLYREIYHQMQMITDSSGQELDDTALDSEEIWIDGLQQAITFGEARAFVNRYGFMCMPSLQDSVPNLIDGVKGFFAATPDKLRELQGLASNLSKDVLREAVATRMEEENREEQLHVY